MYVQITEAAKRLGVSRTWAYVLIKKGKLQTTTVGGCRFVIDNKDFKDLCKKQKNRETLNVLQQ